MPTSSQSLILQTTNGHLPTFFGRRNWRPEVPPGMEGNMLEYPVSVVQVKQGFIGNDGKRQKFKRRPQLLYKPGSAPELSYKLDFSTLPRILTVRGLHGSIQYDSDLQSVNWKINSIGPFYDRANIRRTGLNRTLAPLRYFHGDQGNFSVRQGTDRPGATECANPLDPRRQVRFFESRIKPTSFQGHAENEDFQPWRGNEEDMEIIRTKLENQDCFKLVEVDRQLENKTSEGVSATPLFRLEKCRPTDADSFRLSSTKPGEVGDFKVVAPQGYIVDDFRLVSSLEMGGGFILLQSDTENLDHYRPVQRSRDMPPASREVQGNSRGSVPDQHKMDIVMPREAWVNADSSSDYHAGNLYGNVHKLEGRSKRATNLIASENRYNYFDDVRDLYTFVENEHSLPDISLYESGGHGLLHHNGQTTYKTERDDLGYRDITDFDQHLEEFNRRYTETLQTPTAYNRFVHAGPRGVKNGNRQVIAANTGQNITKRELDAGAGTVRHPVNTRHGTLPHMVKPGESKMHHIANIDNTTFTGQNTVEHGTSTGNNSVSLSSDWTHNFDQWSRTTKVPDPDPSTSSEFQRNIRKLSPINKEEGVAAEDEEVYTIDEVKFKANYKQWKKKKITTMRMRKELPPEDGTAVCIRCADNSLSHTEIKAKIEKQTGHRVLGLQFDPVSVQSLDAEATSRWVIRFEDETIAEHVVASGIRLNGSRCQVRKYDDVVKEEHEAYKFYQMVKKLTGKRNQKPIPVQKNRQKPVSLKTTETQTNNK